MSEAPLTAFDQSTPMFHSTVETSSRNPFRAGSVWLLLGILSLFAACPESLLAQSGRGRRGAAAGDDEEYQGIIRGRGNAPAGVGPGRSRMGIPGQPLDAPRRKSKKSPSAGGLSDGSSGDEADLDRLPRGFSVPPEPPEWLTTTDEWIFDPFRGGDDKEKKRDEIRKVARYKDIAQRGELTKDEDKQLVAEILEWKLSLFTRKENHEKAFRLREEIFRDIKGSGAGRAGRPEARVFMMQTIVDKAPKLFNYHFAARLNGAILLADLSEVNEKEAEGRNPPVRFTKASIPLRELLRQVDEKNRKQPDAVRIWAVDGLTRISLLTETRPTVRYEIVDALVEQMTNSAGDHEWLQWRLAESLGSLGVAYNAFRKPTVPQVLAEVLVDPKRPWLVRAEAAQSLGRLPLDNGIDVGLIAREVAHLAEQMAEAYQKKPDQASWKLAFLKLYLAFKPINDEDAKKDKGLLTQVTNKPILVSHKKLVQEAYDMVLPIVQGVVNPPQNIEAAVGQLRDWLNKNPPRTTRIAEKEDPIIKPPKQGAAQDTPPAGGSPAAG